MVMSRVEIPVFKVTLLLLNVQEVMALFLTVLFSIFRVQQELVVPVMMDIDGKIISVRVTIVKPQIAISAKLGS